MNTDQWGAVIFGLGAAVLALLAVGLCVGYLISRDALYAALGILVSGFSLALFYETYALATGATPTISRITALAFLGNPTVWILFAFGVMFVAGNLAVDLRGLTRLRGWLVSVAIAGLGFGAFLSIKLQWLP